MSCPNCNYPLLTDIINCYNGVPYMVKGCPCCHWTPPMKICTATNTTGSNLVTENYQLTNSYLVYDDERCE